MKIIKCKQCGSTAVSATIEANANDQTSFAELCQEEEVIDEVFCPVCQRHVDFMTEDESDLRKYETDQFRLWQQGKADMFVVWHGHFRRSDHTPISFGHEIFHAAHRAEAWVKHYIESCNLQPGSEVYHSFAIRYFNPKVEVRAELYPSVDKIRAIDVNLYPAVWSRDIK